MVAEGVTWVEPDCAFRLPETPEIVTVVAFCTTQVRVEVLPGVMVEGVAWNTRMLTGLGAETLTSVVALDDKWSVLVTVRRKT